MDTGRLVSFERCKLGRQVAGLEHNLDTTWNKGLIAGLIKGNQFLNKPLISP